MASNAFSGIGTKFYMDSQAIAEINNIDGPNLARDTIDVTSLDSTGGYREFIGGFRDGGEVTLEMNFTESGWIDLKARFEEETNHAYSITLDEGGTNEFEFEFSAWITALGVAVPLDDKITCSVTLKIDGQLTFNSYQQ